jgi:stage II sporulation protein R
MIFEESVHTGSISIWTVFFMKKAIKRVGICLILVSTICLWGLVKDRTQLQQGLVRLHVVAASDSDRDQALKLRVRDAVTESLRKELANLTDPAAAVSYIRENLPRLKALATRALRDAGCEDSVRVSLESEEFSKRIYDTFSLPSGIYRSLRIVIGEGEGQNWWCVVYPSFCLPESAEEVAEAAVCAGLSEELAGAITGKEEYEIRFFLLDLFGRLQNLLNRG